MGSLLLRNPIAATVQQIVPLNAVCSDAKQPRADLPSRVSSRCPFSSE